MKNNSGYTLVELVVSMTLTALLATAVVAVMPAATRVYMHVRDMGRAQMVADMVVDSLREECSETYIDDFTSVRIMNPGASTTGDQAILSYFYNPITTDLDEDKVTSNPVTEGNVLLIRKSQMYCEAIFSDISITEDNISKVRSMDPSPVDTGIATSRAAYRFVSGSDLTSETKQGYVHYGFYRCGYVEKDFPGGLVRSQYPAQRYDYTNPFSNAAYDGYTISLYFENMTFVPYEADEALNEYTERPYSVTVIVRVYKSDQAGQSSDTLLYTRRATLLFAEDINK